MATEKFDVGKLIRGFNPLNGQNLGKLAYYLVIVCLALGAFYVLFIRPTQKTTQRAEQMTNITNVTDESAVDLQLFPPKIKIGGLKLKLFK